jgi:hypothetical protein
MIRLHRPGRGIAWAVLFAFLVCATAASAAKTAANEGEEDAVARCIHLAANGKPWLEKTLWALRDQEGGWVGAEIRNVDGSDDLGPLQINSWWVEKIAMLVHRSPRSVRWWLVHDACFNVEAARWIFLSGMAATHDFWTAIGIYHSPTRWRQQRYANGVAHHLTRRFGPQVFSRAHDRRLKPVPVAQVPTIQP